MLTRMNMEHFDKRSMYKDLKMKNDIVNPQIGPMFVYLRKVFEILRSSSKFVLSFMQLRCR